MCAMHRAAAWARLLSAPITAEHNQSLALRMTGPVPMRVTLLRLLSHWSASLHIAAHQLRLIPLRVRMSDTVETQPWRPPGRGSGRVMSGGGAGGKLSLQLRNQNVAPLPSSTTRPESSSLGGSQERHGEWYQSEITNIQSITSYLTTNKC